MDSDDEQMYMDESDDEDMSDDDELNMVMEPEVSSTTDESRDAEFPHQVLTAADIVQHMVDCIEEVNTIVEVYNIPIVSFHIKQCAETKCIDSSHQLKVQLPSGT